MRKKPNGILTIVMASVALVVGLAVTVLNCAQAERVVVEEKILHGNSSEVANITLTQYDSMEDHLVWTTRTPLADVSQSKTEMKYSREEMRVPWVNEGYCGVSFRFTSTSWTSGGAFDFLNEQYAGAWSGYPAEMFVDVASRTPMGEKHTEIVRVADYGDFYTPFVSVHFSTNQNWNFGLSMEDEERIAEYFRRPVGEDDMAIVTLTHNGGNGISGVEVMLDSCEEEYSNEVLHTVFVGDVCYMVTAGDTGIEIHRARFLGDENRATYTKLIDIEQVATIEDETLLRKAEYSFLAREGRNQLLVLCGEKTLEKVLVFSVDEMAVVQEIAVPFEDFSQIYQHADYFVIDGYDGSFDVYEDCDGQYVKALEGNYGTYIQNIEKLAQNSVAMDYENGRLITAMRQYNKDQTISVVVNNVHGCVFSGDYTTSLQKDPPTDGDLDGRVRQWENKPLEIVRG